MLLAGASGAIGRYLVPFLTDAGHEVIGITRTAGSLSGTGAREVVADVLDRAALLAALDGIQADAVIHQLTALAKPPAAYRDMRATNRLRAEGTSALIAAAKRVGATKFVAASFFGGYGFGDLGRRPLDESAAFGQEDGRNDAVLVALLSLEQQARAFGGMVLRYGLFYDTTTTTVSPVSHTWNGLVPSVHLKDAARAAVLALEKYQPGAIYNVADDRPTTYRERELVRARAAGIRPPQQFPDSLIRMTAPFGAMLLTRVSVSLDSSKARSELGWAPEFPSVFEGVGVVAPIADAVVAASAPAPKTVALPTREPVIEVNFDAILEFEPAADPEPVDTPVPEPVEGPTDSAPVPELVEGPTSTPTPAPIAKHPKAPAKPRVRAKPKDPFADMDAAIARIGAPRDE